MPFIFMFLLFLLLFTRLVHNFILRVYALPDSAWSLALSFFHHICLFSFLPNPVLPYSQSPDYQTQLQFIYFSPCLLFFTSPFFVLTQLYTSQLLHHHQFYDIDISTCSPINGWMTIPTSFLHLVQVLCINAHWEICLLMHSPYSLFVICFHSLYHQLSWPRKFPGEATQPRWSPLSTMCWHHILFLRRAAGSDIFHGMLWSKQSVFLELIEWTMSTLLASVQECMPPIILDMPCLSPHQVLSSWSFTTSVRVMPSFSTYLKWNGSVLWINSWTLTPRMPQRERCLWISTIRISFAVLYHVDCWCMVLLRTSSSSRT